MGLMVEVIYYLTQDILRDFIRLPIIFNSIYAMLKVEIDINQEAKMQILDEVSHVILSHLHADHVGGLIDFPNANCWGWRSAWTNSKKHQGGEDLGGDYSTNYFQKNG